MEAGGVYGRRPDVDEDGFGTGTPRASNSAAGLRLSGHGGLRDLAAARADVDERGFGIGTPGPSRRSSSRRRRSSWPSRSRRRG